MAESIRSEGHFYLKHWMYPLHYLGGGDAITDGADDADNAGVPCLREGVLTRDDHANAGLRRGQGLRGRPSIVQTPAGAARRVNRRPGGWWWHTTRYHFMARSCAPPAADRPGQRQAFYRNDRRDHRPRPHQQRAGRCFFGSPQRAAVHRRLMLIKPGSQPERMRQ